MEKMTNAKAIAYVIENCTVPKDVAEKLEKILASYEKKASAERKPTATQIANEHLKDVILGVLTEATKPMTVSEIIKAHAELATLSTQKISPQLTKLVDEKKIVKTVEKRKSYFSIA
ncbi:MAG: hypothetical protein E7167_01465 [Firmicutes bacterium]|nr:hypothetical protein [Bacillota bacterium]